MATRHPIRAKIDVTSTTFNRVQISQVDLRTTDFSVYTPPGNDAVYIGSEDVDATWIPLNPASATLGAEKNYVHGDGTLDGNGVVTPFNLKNWYVYFTTPGQSVIVEYMIREALDQSV